MLKFIAKVWIAGEVSDFRRGYKRRKALKREARLQQRCMRKNDIKLFSCYDKHDFRYVTSFIMACHSNSFSIFLILLCKSYFYLFKK